jgi:hypothetical protein
MLIHAGVNPHKDSISEIERRYGVAIERDQMRYGGIIGCVELFDVVTEYPPLWFEGPFGFVLA